MKIVKLVSRNIKNLKAIEITPAGEEVLLTGANGAGKSAIIDSIFSALTGKRLKDPIRHGEERADVEVDMGDFIVKKRWTEKGESIQVYSTTAEGKKVTHGSPQTFLDEKIGELSFDPMEFKNRKPMDQIELLKKIAGLDFAEIEKDKATVYDERSIHNSKIKESIAHLKNTQAPDPQTPDEEIKFKDALERLNALRKKQEVYLGTIKRRDHSLQEIENAKAESASITDEIVHLRKRSENVETFIRETQRVVEEQAIPPIISQDDIKVAEIELEQIETKNVDIRAAKRYRQSIKDADKLKKESDKLTERLARLDQDKSIQVAAAKFPIPGLSLSDDAVMYEGNRFDRLSTGQQIRVSTAIGMALNPELKVVFIRNGSMLDSGNLKEIIAQAKDKDYQVWLERCDESGQVGFFIEAGEVKSVNGKEVPKEI